MQEGGTLSTSTERDFTFTAIPDPYDVLVQPGCSGACIYIPDTTYKTVVSDICKHMDCIEDVGIRIQVRGFCSTLSTGLTGLQPGINIDPMYADIQEDEAYFEWIFDNFRFGFSFHQEISDSYWFLVAKNQDGTSIRFKGDFKAGFAGPVGYTLDYIRSNA